VITLRAVTDFDSAIKYFDEEIRRKNDVVWAYARQADTLGKEDYDRVFPDFNEAIRRMPDFDLAYRGRGLTSLRKGDDAIADAHEVIRLQPKYMVGYNDRARVYRQKDDLNRTIADFSQVPLLALETADDPSMGVRSATRR
jgi:tetratricopeptide (TPR) repeat protein